MEVNLSRTRQSWPWWRWVLTGLSLLGLALSGYLGWHYLMGGDMIGCGGGSPCDQVLNSRWSTIGGLLPVGGLAEGAYLAMLVASFFVGSGTTAPVRQLAWRAMLVLVGAAAGSALWFIVLQEWFIGAFCPYCMATHFTGLLLAAFVIWQAPKRFNYGSSDVAQTNPAPNATTGAATATPVPDSPPATPWHLIGAFPAIGLALAAILAVCQVVFAPPAVYRAGVSPEQKLPALDPRAMPVVGSPDARYVIALLFDYQCPHCQRLHAMLDEVIRRYQGRLAFVLCPAPLDPQCNPYISRETDEFKDSCALAKIALAVWVANRTAFPGFDRWMFSPEPGHLWHPRSLEAATAKAIELVGQTNFEAARNDPWIDRHLQMSVQIYGGTAGTAVPKLVLGSHWVTPEPNNADDLVSILHASLALPTP